MLNGCIIGRRCKIGPRVVLTGVHIWNDVVVEEACNITASLLCDKVIVRKVSCCMLPPLRCLWRWMCGSLELDFGKCVCACVCAEFGATVVCDACVFLMLLQNVIVERGCLLDFGVVVGSDRTVPELTTLTTTGTKGPGEGGGWWVHARAGG